MKQEFMQKLLDKIVEKRVFGPFHQIKNFDGISMEKYKKEMENDPVFQAVKETAQDPKELREMLEISFDKSFKKLKEHVLHYFDLVTKS